MLRKRFKAALAVLPALVLALAIALAPSAAYADSSSTIVTLGADLTDEQRETVLEFFGLTEDDLDSMEVIEVTNTDEREYLEGTLDDSIIGYKTLSCSYVQITDSGGINVQTANLTYVTSDIIYNALQTAGIENCNVVVTAPYDVSGTGALTGIFMAFEADGTELDEDKKEAATEELVATAELEDTYGEEAAEIIGDVKNEVVSATEDMSDEEISELVDETASEYGITLSEEDLATITELIASIQQLDYDTNAFSDTLSGLSENASGIWATIKSFFSSIVEFFTNLFSSGSDGSDSILDDLNTDVYELDDSGTGEVVAESSGSDTTSSESSDDTASAESDSSASTDAGTSDTSSDTSESADVSADSSTDAGSDASEDTSSDTTAAEDEVVITE